MPEKPPADVGPGLHDSLSLLQDVDLRSVMSREDELAFRMQLAQCLKDAFKLNHDPRDLYAAIDHAEVAVRLAASSHDKVEMLNTLSYLKMSAFYLNESALPVKEAVVYARKARAELGVGSGDDRQRLIVYENLGHALSAKAQLEGNLEALDEAIECARELVRLSSEEELKALTAVNLAQRLHLRYQKMRRECDATEALDILAKSRSILRPESAAYAVALFAQGDICLGMHRFSGDIEILNQAIANYEQGLDSYPGGNERQVDILRRLGGLYETKHQRTTEVSALRNAARYFGMALTHVPNHPRRMEFITGQIKRLAYLAKAEQSLTGLESALDQARSLLAQIPPQHATRDTSAQEINFILTQRYFKSRNLAHLEELVTHVLETGNIWNNMRRPRGAPIDLTAAEALRSCLSGISRCTSSGDTLSASDTIYGLYQAACQTSEPAHAVLDMYLQHGPALEQLCRPKPANTTDEPPPDTEIKRVTGTRSAFATIYQGMLQRLPEDFTSSWPRNSYRDPLFGQRYLAQPASGRVIMGLEGWVQDVMGYKDDPVPSTLEECLIREARLEAEALQRERAEQKNPDPSLCRVCRQFEPLKRAKDGNGTISWNGEIYFPWGTWRQLQGRSHCVVCRLVLSLLTTTTRNNEQTLHPRLDQIDPEIQGVQLELQELHDNGELVLGVRYGLVVVGGLRIVSEDNRQNAIRDGDNAPLLSKVQAWLQHCELDHGPRCRTFPGENRCKSPIPLLFVDVANQCLVRATSAEKYFALSYVWGGPQTTATTKSSVETRYKSGSLAKSQCVLPWTIRDAMALVERLGERYLWVDSLCIVQDDAEHKHRDIQRMDIVYMMAFATIVAAHGHNADAGLPGIRPRTRRSQMISSISIQESPSSVRPDSRSILLTTTASPLRLALESSVWESRGWVLQEKLLSRRCIYFTSDWIYFQCGRETICETASDGFRPVRRVPDPQAESDVLSMDNPLVMLNKVGLITENQRLCRAFEVYTKLVDMYVSRDLSVSSDIIKAFSGILMALEEHFPGGFVSALPAATLDLALLWTPGLKMLERSHYATASKTSSSRPYFPSWSWTGWVTWVGRPAYHHLFANPQSQPLPEALVDSFGLQYHGTFHVIRARGSTSAREPSTQTLNVSGPDFGPDVLQFWADAVDADIFRFKTDELGVVEPERLSTRENVHTETAQAIIRLEDRLKRQCGLWYDNKNHRLWRRAQREKKKPRTELVAISRLVAHVIKGPVRVEGEIAIFDRMHFSSDGPEGGIVNCLVVEWYDEIAFRVTVAQVHWAAWQKARPRRKHIRLA